MEFFTEIFVLLALVQTAESFKEVGEKAVLKHSNIKIINKHPKAMTVALLNDEDREHEDHRHHRGRWKGDRDDDGERGPHWSKGWAKGWGKGKGGGHHHGPPEGFRRHHGPVRIPSGGRGGDIRASNTNIINVKVNVIQENNNKQKAPRS